MTAATGGGVGGSGPYEQGRPASPDPRDEPGFAGRAPGVTPSELTVADAAMPPGGVGMPGDGGVDMRPLRRRAGVGFWMAVGFLGLLVAVALLAPVLPIADPLEVNEGMELTVPSADHPLGTDALGRDVLARVIWGARVSLSVGLGAVALGLLVGGTIGLVGGWVRGILDNVIVAVLDILLAFPTLVLALAMVTYLGRSQLNVTIAIAVVAVPIIARIMRANTLSARGLEFVVAAQAAGATSRRILVREVLPGVIPPVLANSLIAVALAIVAEGALSFLGLGVPLPTATWGGMIAEGRRHLEQDPQLVLVPSVALFLTVLSLNVVAEGLRRRWDPARET